MTSIRKSSKTIFIHYYNNIIIPLNNLLKPLPYNHWNNPIEKCFYQLKTYIRRDEPKKIINLLIIFYAGKIILRLFFSPMSYEEIKKTIKKAIKNITKDNLYNYFKSSLEKRDIKNIKTTKFMKKSKIYKK